MTSPEKKCCKACLVTHFEFEPGEISPTTPHCCNPFCPCHKDTEGVEEPLRQTLEKIAWRHYNPRASINVEEMLDEMMPYIHSHETSLREKIRKEIEGLKEGNPICLRHKPEECDHCAYIEAVDAAANIASKRV